MSGPKIIRLRHKTTPEPSGCRWCGRIERSHGMYYTTAKGIHLWEPPTLAQRKARIIANIRKREASIVPKEFGPLMQSARRQRETKEERKLRLRADRGRM